MEAVERHGLRASSDRIAGLNLPAISAFVVPFALILYLALENGGYDIVERSQAAIAVWWIVLIGTAIGVLPAAGGTRAGRVMLALLAGFALWTALSLGWTESGERTSIELGRTFAYLGFFAAALAVQGTAGWRPLLHGITAAVVVVCGIAVLSRLEPNLFPERVTGEYLPGIEIERRLAYPLNYSSGLGALAAIGLPLLLATTYTTRSRIVEALSAAAIPVVALALWLTTSSLSVPAAAIGLGAFILLSPDRLPKIGTALIAGAGSAILFAAAEQRDALDRGVPTPAALEQGDSMLAVVLVVCVGVGLMQAGLGLLLRHGTRPSWMQVGRREAAIATAAVTAAVLVIGLAAGGAGAVGDAIDDFKSREGQDAAVDESRGAQILDFNSSGRYQFWEAAAEANASDPWKGIGPGTFEYWWSREGSYAGFVRDAHSLYLETLGELGIIGLVLVGGFVLGVLGLGAVRALRAPPETRLAIAAATAGCAAFAAAAAVDWTWELGVLPAIFMGLAAIAVAAGARHPRTSSPGRPWLVGNGGRIAVCVLAVAGIAAVSVPLTAADDLSASRAAVADGDLSGAFDDARNASDVEPYAASPHLQQALVLERAGRIEAAAIEASLATADEPTNWRTWFVRSRLEARVGDAEGSVAALRRARELHPNNPLLQPVTTP
jgi:O-antigen ligase